MRRGRPKKNKPPPPNSSPPPGPIQNKTPSAASKASKQASKRGRTIETVLDLDTKKQQPQDGKLDASDPIWNLNTDDDGSEQDAKTKPKPRGTRKNAGNTKLKPTKTAAEGTRRSGRPAKKTKLVEETEDDDGDPEENEAGKDRSDNVQTTRPHPSFHHVDEIIGVKYVFAPEPALIRKQYLVAFESVERFNKKGNSGGKQRHWIDGTDLIERWMCVNKIEEFEKEFEAKKEQLDILEARKEEIDETS